MFQSLTNFILGLYVSLILERIYYAQRAMLGGAFGGLLGFALRLLSSVKPPDGDPLASRAPVLPGHIKAVQRQLIRWTNAIFRLLWLESCEYESQIADDIHIMDGNLGPLLTEDEWHRIKDVPSRVTHIIYWINTSVDDLKKAGYVDPQVATELANQLNEVRSSNNFGLSSLPYQYVYLISSITKLMIIFKTLQKSFEIGLLTSARDFFSNRDPDTRIAVLGVLIIFQLMVEAWVYQALLELYIVLRNPNQGKLSGHMPTPDFLQFTEAVTAGLLTQQETVPRPLFGEDSDDDDDDSDVELQAEEETPHMQSTERENSFHSLHAEDSSC